MAEESLKQKASFISLIYDKINSVLGNDNQLFTMEFPGRGLNPADFEYSTENRTSIITKPYSVREREFRLTDDLFNVAKITGGPTGEKLSTVFDTIINNYVPKLDSYTKFAKDKTLLRHWLMEDKEFVEKDGTKVTSSRIAYCEKLMNKYLEQKLAWEQKKNTEFDKKRKEGIEDVTETINGKQVTKKVENPEKMLQAMDDYARWLSTEGIVQDEKLNQAYNDVVVRGHLHEVMTFLGFLNASTTAEALESTKQFMRNSARLSFDSSSKIYPVNLNPSNWFKALRPNFAPKDLTMSKEALAAQYRSKTTALAQLKEQKAELLIMHVDTKDISNAQTDADKAEGDVRTAEAEFVKQNTQAALEAAKIAYEAAKASSSGGLSLFTKKFLSLSGEDKTSDQLKTMYDTMKKVSTALDKALAAKEKFVTLKAKAAMLATHNFQSQIQKLDSQISLLTNDIQYLQPLVSGTMYLAAKEEKALQKRIDVKVDPTGQSVEKKKWVLEKMKEQYLEELLKVSTSGVLTKGKLNSSDIEDNTINSIEDATKLPKVLKEAYKAFEGEYDKLAKLKSKSDGLEGMTKSEWILEQMMGDTTCKSLLETKDKVGVIQEKSTDGNIVIKVVGIDFDKLTDETLKSKYNEFAKEFDELSKIKAEAAEPKPLLPDADIDISDLSFSDIIISSSDVMSYTANTSQSDASQTTASINLFFTSAKVNHSTSSSESSFESTALKSEFSCGFRVAKVTIDRGGWFNPTLLKMSDAFYKLADLRAGAGLEVTDLEGDGAKAKLKISAKETEAVPLSLLPAYPIAFVIAKDITFKIENSETVSRAYNQIKDGKSSGGGGFGPFSATSASSSSSSHSTAYTGTHGDSLYIRIPGPQIIGWYMQFTPEDKATSYMQQSGKDSTGAVDALTIDDETILLELRLRREQLEDKMRNEGNPFA